MKWLISTVRGTVLTISLWVTISPATSPWVTTSPGCPGPCTELPAHAALTFSPAWALQDLPQLLSSSPGAALTLLHPTATAQHLTGMAAGLHNSCLDKRALGAQSKCISPHCCSDFPCSHWRHKDSQEAVCC